MKKVKLQNMQSMSMPKFQGPLDGSLNLNENGLLNDSGVIDESGNIGQVFKGLAYNEIGVNAIQVEYVCVWTRTEQSYGGVVSLNDGSNPDASGYSIEPITNSDPDFFRFLSQYVDEVGTFGTGTVAATWHICYEYREWDSLQNKYTPWEQRFAYGTMNFSVPSYIDLVRQQQEQSGIV